MAQHFLGDFPIVWIEEGVEEEQRVDIYVV